MTTPEFNEEIHAPVRLKICANLYGVKAMEFSTLRDRLDVADSVLSKHISRLMQAGYLDMNKASADGHLRSWVSLTAAGHKAYENHIAALRQIAGL